MSKVTPFAGGQSWSRQYLVKLRYFLILSVLFSGILFASIMAEAQMKVISTLACEQNFNPNSPDFVQGAEKYFDLRYTGDEKLFVSYATPERGPSTLFPAEDTQSVDWDVLGGRIFARWNSGPYLTLMEVDSQWRGYLMFPSNVDPAANPFGVAEIELKCGIVRW